MKPRQLDEFQRNFITLGYRNDQNRFAKGSDPLAQRQLGQQVQGGIGMGADIRQVCTLFVGGTGNAFSLKSCYPLWKECAQIDYVVVEAKKNRENPSIFIFSLGNDFSSYKLSPYRSIRHVGEKICLGSFIRLPGTNKHTIGMGRNP